MLARLRTLTVPSSCGQVDGLTFRLTCSTASGDQRAERRYATYTGGTRQFDEPVAVLAPDATGTTLTPLRGESNVVRLTPGE
ncbi:hypothetical protein [Streptomyces bicolor]|uniref:hypothetical protein n=1 Tax=Streptomyces bicolor TaxID=66874 RepID=UPI0004E17E33|nr:hypothetical protein [Streptomyces bicolor]